MSWPSELDVLNCKPFESCSGLFMALIARAELVPTTRYRLSLFRLTQMLDSLLSCDYRVEALEDGRWKMEDGRWKRIGKRVESERVKGNGS